MDVRPPAGTAPAPTVVWSAPLRALHWTLAASVIASFATHEGGGRAHEILGYVALGAAALRIVAGFAGGPGWRFAGFVRGLRDTLAYAKRVASRCEPRYLGHNPLGGWMIVALLAMSVAASLSGWLYTTDAYWGVEWVEALHGVLGDALVPLFALHVAGVIVASLRHRESLVGAMIHGRKRPAGPQDVALPAGRPEADRRSGR
jgi:cytochrome b